MDVLTLFAANAIILLVMAGGFLAAWLRQHDDHWLNWLAGNLSLAVALFMLMYIPVGLSFADAGPHCLLVLGFGLKWRAARGFTGHPTGWLPVWAPVGVTIALFALPNVYAPGTVFALINVILTTQAAATAAHFWRERRQTAPSSYGLVFAYGLMAASFAARMTAGFVIPENFTAYLPHDWMLQLHLLVAIVHTSASGAFALSIAYERSAIHLRRERDRARSRAQILGELAELAERDALTGLMNRRAVEPCFAELCSNGFRTLALVDLDHFKIVNDRFGHATGDAALRAAAAALSPDADCLVVRLGGEEFMLLLRGKDARERAEGRRQAIPARVSAEVPEIGPPVTASMGLIELPCGELDEIDFEAGYAAADKLLYMAKAQGRDRTVADETGSSRRAMERTAPAGEAGAGPVASRAAG